MTAKKKTILSLQITKNSPKSHKDPGDAHETRKDDPRENSKAHANADKTAKAKKERPSRIKLHKSFRRSYREDYVRDLKAPGLMQHAVNTFKLIFKNWRIFLPLIALIVTLNIFLIGLLSEETYSSLQNSLDETNEALASGKIGSVGKAAITLISTITTGGLNNGMSEVQQLLVIVFGLITWLVTIYLVRHLLAGHTPRLRDGLYNALTPLISTFCVLAVIILEAIPIFIVVVAYSAAISTEFLATPLYALIFFIFASLLTLLSVYLISSSFLALIAVTAPGLYPLTAINTATDLVIGRRIRLLVRTLFSLVVLAVCWIVVMMPIILIDGALKPNVEWLANIPIVPFFLSVMTTFSFVYFSAYSYLYYRQLLDYNSEK